MDFYKIFNDGRTYEDFLKHFGSPEQVAAWDQTRTNVLLNESQTTLLKSFTREINVLCMSGTWCGDCVQQCPIFDVFQKTASRINIRYVDRDENEQLKSALTICGGSRVPQVVFMSEDGAFVSRAGDRTLARYREMASKHLGSACPSGIAGQPGDPVFQAVVQDWLNEFERVHLILRLSPRLRQIHND